MIAALRRRAAQLATDPVLRRWTAARLAGRVPSPDLSRRDPPYLADLTPGAAPVAETFRALAAAPPLRAVVLPLPGEAIRVVPGEEAAVFHRRFADTETMLALHRFAWVPLMGETLDLSWVAALWRGWMATSFPPREGWAWHPYTAAERAINLLDFARVHGMPAPMAKTREALLAHGPAIRGSLEYFGEGYTSNHLANDGRGLFLLGLALGDAASADVGGRILVEEAKRIFRPSGMLREGATHYHALLARNYAVAAEAARAHRRPEAEALAEIARRALAVVPALTLPGGMPLIGDISPDVPPDAMPRHTSGGTAPVHDGWGRVDCGGWSALTYASPDGLPPIPGHGHQDMASFELHRGAEVVIRDPGRGTYMNADDVGAAAQNGVSIDGADPYPTNRAYYDDTFRRSIAGPPPQLAVGADEMRVAYRWGARRWRFTPSSVEVEDELAGSGTHRVTRRLHTTLPVRIESGVATLDGRYRVHADAPLTTREAVCWTAYGEGTAATCIEARSRVALPATLRLEIRA
jgi:hypothetical protein